MMLTNDSDDEECDDDDNNTDQDIDREWFELSNCAQKIIQYILLNIYETACVVLEIIELIILFFGVCLPFQWHFISATNI